MGSAAAPSRGHAGAALHGAPSGARQSAPGPVLLVGRGILADDELQKVFGKEKVTTFEMNKPLARHLK